MIGNSSPGVLKRIAHRLINGPNPVAEESSSGNIIPKDSTEYMRCKFAQAEGATPQEGDRPFGSWIPELDSIPVGEPAELDGNERRFEMQGSTITYPEMPGEVGQAF